MYFFMISKLLVNSDKSMNMNVYINNNRIKFVLTRTNH